MKKDTYITAVVFRKFKGEIIALFPYEVWAKYTCSSYMHIGQHAEADYTHVIQHSKPAKESEYRDLKHELENSAGYNLKVLKKINGTKMSQAFESYFKRRVKHYA